MGKPSLRRIPKKSDQSFSSNTTLNSRKMEKKRKNRANTTNKSIQKLFDHLFESETSTVVSETTVIKLDNKESHMNIKRKLSEMDFIPLHRRKRKNESNSSLLVIKDDIDLIASTKPCHSLFTPKKSNSTSTVQCSTPKNENHTKGLKDFILNMNNNNTLNSQKNFVKEVNDLTEVLNNESLFTIDLTGTLNNSSLSNAQNTVIDLVNTTDNADCSFGAISQASLSMSGDSEVTVIRSPYKKSNKKRMNKYISGLAKMNKSQEDRMEMLMEYIFNGCNVATLPNKVTSGLQNLRALTDRSTDTLEDTYIKEVIVGHKKSRNSIGSNIYNPERDAKNKTGLRMIIIDGSNVAMEHGKGRVFSVKGLKICIEYFLHRGHKVKAFVPRFRCKYGKSTDPRLLDSLERSGLVVYTPSREIQGRLVASYDDRYIVQCAAEFDGVIVSGDNYRDLLRENPRWRVVIEERLLPFTWVDNMLMIPGDPLGRNGPSLETFLRHPQLRPGQSNRS